MNASHPLPPLSQVSRRGFLQASAALAVSSRAAASRAVDDRAVILLLLVGGPSPMETFDPKPDAPLRDRGPFRSIATRVPGLYVSEHLPRLARRLDRVALVRAVHHDAAPIHESGLQLLQTGRLSAEGAPCPHLGAIAAERLGRRNHRPAWVILPTPLESTGVAIDQGQARTVGEPDCRPALPRHGDLERLAAREPARIQEAYGPSGFARACLAARRLVELGSRMVVVNMYPGVFNVAGWDVHGAAPFSTFDDYDREVVPTFDRAFDALLNDLESRGLLERTMVVASGEFGRTPRINARGGRDHWPAAWTALVAGGGVQGGRAIGATDRSGGEPKERPVPLTELAALLGNGLGLADAGPAPLRELFA